MQNNPILRIDPTGALDTLPDGRNIWELDNREMQLFSEASTRSQVTGCNCDIQLSIPERLYMFGKMLTFAMPSARILKGATVIDDIARVGDDAGRLTRLSTKAIVEEEVVETVVEGAAKGSTKTLTQQADDLVRLNGGKNSVTLRTSTKQIRYDLAGKAHNGVPTPYKQIYNMNFYQGQVRSITRASKDATPMTQQEIRMIRKYLQGLK